MSLPANVIILQISLAMHRLHKHVWPTREVQKVNVSFDGRALASILANKHACDVVVPCCCPQAGLELTNDQQSHSCCTNV